MLKGKKYIIFDLDGTLIDSVGIWNEVDRRYITALGGSYEGVDVQLQRDTMLRKFHAEKDPYLEYCGYMGEKYGSTLSKEELVKLRYTIARELTENEVDYKPFADVFLKKLKANGYTLIIASTTRRSNMETYRTKNKNTMKKAPLDEIFAAIYTREDAKEMKPSPEIYNRIFDEWNTNKEECLVFEDSLIGVEAANNAGIDVVAIYDKYSDSDRAEINRRTIAHFDSYEQLLSTIGD